MDAQHMMGFGTIAATPAFAGLGVLVGFAHLKLLSWNIRALTGGLRSLVVLAALPIRAGTAVATFSFAAIHGDLPLMATLAGFLLARTVLVRRPEILVS
jgi:hypothetical protein